MSNNLKAELVQIKESVCGAFDKMDLRLLGRELVSRTFEDPLDVELLSEVGIPLVEEFEISFNLAESLPPLREYLGDRRCYRSEWPIDLRCLNAKEDVVYGIDKTQRDAVVCVDLRGENPVLFINRRVRYLIGFLAECRLHLSRMRAGADKRNSFELSLNRMRSWDGKAVDQGWWQGVFETVNFYG